MTPDYQRLLSTLVEHQVDFVVIGAVALVLHGSNLLDLAEIAEIRKQSAG